MFLFYYYLDTVDVDVVGSVILVKGMVEFKGITI